jgi:hypothetical protein
MRETATVRPSIAWIVAAIAAVFALVSTSIAADPVAKLTKAKVKKIVNVEIGKRAPGLSVDKAKSAETATRATTAAAADTATTADSATTATSAATADTLDGLDSQAFLRAGLCARGKVLAFAYFDPAAMSAAPTYSTAGVTVPENCAGGTVEASRVGTGDVRIRFNGLNALLATCTAIDNAGDVQAAPRFISLSIIGSGHWRASIVDHANVGSNAKFTCIVA